MIEVFVHIIVEPKHGRSLSLKGNVVQLLTIDLESLRGFTLRSGKLLHYRFMLTLETLYKIEI